MMRGVKPGYHTELSITVDLKNGKRHRCDWITSGGIKWASHKALAWAREDMQLAAVRGRSQIVGIRIHAEEIEGDYDEIEKL